MMKTLATISKKRRKKHIKIYALKYIRKQLSKCFVRFIFVNDKGIAWIEIKILKCALFR